MDFPLNQSIKMNIKPVKYEHVTTFGVAQPVFLVLGGGGTCEGTCWNWSSVRGLGGGGGSTGGGGGCSARDCRLASDFSGHMLQPSVLPTTKLLLKNVAGFALQPCSFYCPALSPLRQPVVPVSEMAKCQRFWRQKRCHSVPNSLR